MAVDEIDYRVLGDDMQAVVVTLDPGEAMIAEAGAMMYLEPDIEMATQMGTAEGGGLLGKLFEAGKRAMAGESFFITSFHNQGPQRRDCAFAAPYPGHIVPVELGEHGGALLCQKDAFLCAARGVQIGIAFQKRLGVGFFGGEGFILQKLTSDSGAGQVFLHAGGTVLLRDLAEGEKLRVDTGCLVALEASVDYRIEFVKGIRNKLLGGEGLFYASLTGPGRVWLQTLPFSRLADRVIAASPSSSG